MAKPELNETPAILKSKKELIIESFQSMDSLMLEVLLDDYKSYEDEAKEVFVERINEAFSRLKMHGDTFLTPYKGFCQHKLCGNNGCEGYSFLGNNSKNHIDLIFEETDNEVTDISQCNGFVKNDSSVETGFLLDLETIYDDELSFPPSKEFKKKIQKCKSAYKELIQHQNRVIGKEVYADWIEKFSDLYESFRWPNTIYPEIDKFLELYRRINKLNNSLQSSDAAKEALKEFQNIDQSNETELLKWLTKYEQIRDKVFVSIFEDIDVENLEADAYFIVDLFKISTSDFIDVARFNCLIDKHYWKMLDKYTTFSKLEAIQHVGENDEMANFVTSLSYHLEKRGMEL